MWSNIYNLHVFSCSPSPFALCNFLLQKRRPLACSGKISYNSIAVFGILGVFCFIFFFRSQVFIHSNHSASVCDFQRNGRYMVLFLISQRSGTNSLSRYQHSERIRCVRKEFNFELLKNRTGRGGKIFDKYTIVNWMIKTEKHNSQHLLDQLLMDKTLSVSSRPWSAYLHD